MKKLSSFATVVTLLLLFSGLSAFAQPKTLLLSQGDNQFDITATTRGNISFHHELATLSSLEVAGDNQSFVQLVAPGYNYSMQEGAPMLPMIKRLMEIPAGATYEIIITNVITQTYRLRDFDIALPLFPAQPSVSKSDERDHIPLVLDVSVYKLDEWFGFETVTIEEMGEMRGTHLARLEVSPFRYNPVRGELQVITAFDGEIRFSGGQPEAAQAEKARLFSPYYNSIFDQLVNYQKPDPEESSRALPGTAPVTYIIVSHSMFQAALQPFVAWKTKKGFKVIEAYTNNPAVGSTTTSIKNYLKNFYNNPPQGVHPQTFVLIVGDVAQVPAFNGTTGSHVTDLYYCEYTNDFFPECFYGRFSATTLAQLQAQIDKTLEYEQYAFPDPTFLDEVVLVAGKDASHQLTYGNGQINYGTQYYFNAAHGLLSHTYLQPEPSGGNYPTKIRQNVSNGVAYANYSAHCSPDGWADPSFTISHISALTNAHKYALMVGNCCSSVEFQTTCFGEEIMRAPLKGAIGYIGGSNSTYWDEDFRWGVGYENISSNPTYNSTHLGAYDRTFHDRTGITTNDWYVTQGQMPSAGNLAVTQSGSPLKNYYWEIYHLMGDPSLMVYFSQAPAISVSYPQLLPLSTTMVEVNTAPYAYVAISKNGALVGAALANSSGLAQVNLLPVTQAGVADVVVTGQNLRPWQGTVMFATPNGPFISVESYAVNDAGANGNGLAEYGETVSFDISFKNIGNATGNNINLTLTSSSPFVTTTQAQALLPTINAGQTIALSDIFKFTIAANVPDEEALIFTLKATSGSDVWENQLNIIAHAPLLAYSSYTINDASGNNNGKLDPGETVTFTVSAINNGSAAATAVMGKLTTASPYITMITTQPQPMGNLTPDATASAGFSLTCSPSTPAGQSISFNFNITATQGITANGTFSAIAGQIPVLIVDLDGNHNSANLIAAAINANGIATQTTTTFPANPNLYTSVFVCLGIYSSNHALTVTEGQALTAYLNGGGRLYMEGGDTWYYDTQTPVHGMFGIQGLTDGSGDLGTITGVSNTMTQGMSFTYSGDNSWIDRLSAVNGGVAILNNQSPQYTCAVINEAAVYRTIGMSMEFGGFTGNRNALMEKYLLFFGLLQPLAADFTADATTVTEGTTIHFINQSTGNPQSFLWNFPGAVPATSTAENPMVTYPNAGVYSVTLKVTSGANSVTAIKNNYITVLPAGFIQTIPIHSGWNGISSALIPDNNNLEQIFGAHLGQLIILQDMQGMFIPGQQINTIGGWNYQTGYKIKATADFEIEIAGTLPVDNHLTLPAGWSLLPVLSTEAANPQVLFANNMEKLMIIKDVAGSGVYWPTYEINTLGMLQPGVGYLILVTEEMVISFD
jgi:PKD repeat protein